MRFFSPDSKLMQAISRISDLVILNILFLITCIPLFTIGASLTALYTVCFKLGTDKEEGAVRPYLRAFRENFKQSTAAWLILVFFGGATIANIALAYSYSGVLGYTYLVFIGMFFLLLMIGAYVFPLISQFYNDTKSTLKNALLLSVGHLPRTIIMVVFNVLPFALFLSDLYLFFYCAMIWVLIYFSAAAYLNANILRKVFAPFRPAEEPEHMEEEV